MVRHFLLWWYSVFWIYASSISLRLPSLGPHYRFLMIFLGSDNITVAKMVFQTHKGCQHTGFQPEANV